MAYVYLVNVSHRFNNLLGDRVQRRTRQSVRSTCAALAFQQLVVQALVSMLHPQIQPITRAHGREQTEDVGMTVRGHVLHARYHVVHRLDARQVRHVTLLNDFNALRLVAKLRVAHPAPAAAHEDVTEEDAVDTTIRLGLLKLVVHQRYCEAHTLGEIVPQDGVDVEACEAVLVQSFPAFAQFRLQHGHDPLFPANTGTNLVYKTEAPSASNHEILKTHHQRDVGSLHQVGGHGHSLAERHHVYAEERRRVLFSIHVVHELQKPLELVVVRDVAEEEHGGEGQKLGDDRREHLLPLLSRDARGPIGTSGRDAQRGDNLRIRGKILWSNADHHQVELFLVPAPCHCAQKKKSAP
mmetsp:Transcript_27659/g.72932  ORF Transcript_27659/g.72932 Transcript_27659/m.72932 type:complete len:353 (-) Transcript_27659:8-1066(-)